MGSVKLLKMQCHKELKRERERRSSSPAPAGRAQQQQVGGGGSHKPPFCGRQCLDLGTASPGDVTPRMGEGLDPSPDFSDCPLLAGAVHTHSNSRG